MLKKSFCMSSLAFLLPILLCGSLFAADIKGKQGLVVTILPNAGVQSSTALRVSDLSLKLNGKEFHAESLSPLKIEQSPVEVIFLLDASLRKGVNSALLTVQAFARELPKGSTIGVSFMENSASILTSPLNPDPEVAAKAMSLSSGAPVASGSPYLCLIDLARRWPSTVSNARRIIVMVSDGVDPRNISSAQADADTDSTHADPVIHGESSLDSTLNNLVEHNIVVNTLVLQGRSVFSESQADTLSGSTLMNAVSVATGGSSLVLDEAGVGGISAYFKVLRDSILNHQYLLVFSGNLPNKAKQAKVTISSHNADVKILAPELLSLGGKNILPDAGNSAH